MQDIRVYDFEFNLLHIENRYISSNFDLMYNDVGSTEYHFPIQSDILPVIMENDYLVLIQGDKQSIVTGKQITSDLAVFGRTCNWILTRRTTPAFKTSELSINKDSESVARWVVEQAFSDVDNFVLGPVCGLESYEEFWRNTTNVTFDVVRDCLARQDAGHRVLFDTANKQWVFEVYQGTKRQTIVSEANRSAYDTQYTENLADYYTSGYYEFTPEAEEGQEPPPSEWLYLSGDKTGIYKWDAVLSGSTESEAKSDLKNRRWEKEITASLRNMEFGKDYQLGDQLRIQLQSGRFQKTFEKEITGVNFYAQDNEIGEKPIFNEEE